MRHLKCLARTLLLLAAFTAMAVNPAFAADITPALTATFGHEGGFQKNPDDVGNYVGGKLVGTKYGIAAKFYPKEDIPNLTVARASFIYGNDFWGASRCDEWQNQIIANNYFDLAVNLGQGTAARIIQRAANLSGWPRAPIAVDGVIGKGTVQRLNEVDQTLLYVNLIGLAHDRYIQVVEKNPKMMVHFKGWMYRVKRNVQKSVHDYEALRKGVNPWQLMGAAR